MISVTFTGGAQLAARLRELKITDAAQLRILRESAEPMRKQMAVLAPHEPGKPDLRDAMVISPTRKRDDEFVYDHEIAVAVGPSTKGFYGFFQEFGTVAHGAQPFARPAFDSERSLVLSRLLAGLWAAVQAALEKRFRGQASHAGVSRARSSGVGL